MLRENFEILRKCGVIGYETAIAPPNFVHDREFFVAVSGLGIYGPFRQKTDLYEDTTDLGFVRLVWQNGYVNGTRQAVCPHRFDCEPIDGAPLNRYIPLINLESSLGTRIWSSIWTIELTTGQFEKFAKVIRG